MSSISSLPDLRWLNNHFAAEEAKVSRPNWAVGRTAVFAGVMLAVLASIVRQTHMQEPMSKRSIRLVVLVLGGMVLLAGCQNQSPSSNEERHDGFYSGISGGWTRPDMKAKAVSCGVLVTDGERLLLGHATRSPRWDIPKGMAEPGESLRRSRAARAVRGDRP